MYATEKEKQKSPTERVLRSKRSAVIEMSLAFAYCIHALLCVLNNHITLQNCEKNVHWNQRQ